VSGAIPAIVGLALPVQGWSGEDDSPGNPEPIRAVYRLFPDLMLGGVQRLLRDNSKHVRIPACNGALIIIEVDPRWSARTVTDRRSAMAVGDQGVKGTDAFLAHLEKCVPFGRQDFVDAADRTGP